GELNPVGSTEVAPAAKGKGDRRVDVGHRDRGGNGIGTDQVHAIAAQGAGTADVEAASGQGRRRRQGEDSVVEVNARGAGGRRAGGNGARRRGDGTGDLGHAQPGQGTGEGNRERQRAARHRDIACPDGRQVLQGNLDRRRGAVVRDGTRRGAVVGECELGRPD